MARMALHGMLGQRQQGFEGVTRCQLAGTRLPLRGAYGAAHTVGYEQLCACWDNGNGGKQVDVQVSGRCLVMRLGSSRHPTSSICLLRRGISKGFAV